MPRIPDWDRLSTSEHVWWYKLPAAGDEIALRDFYLNEMEEIGAIVVEEDYPLFAGLIIAETDDTRFTIMYRAYNALLIGEEPIPD